MRREIPYDDYAQAAGEYVSAPTPGNRKAFFFRLDQAKVPDPAPVINQVAAGTGEDAEILLSDFLLFQEDIEAIRKAKPVPNPGPPPKPKQAEPKQQTEQKAEAPLTIPLSSIEPQPVNWLWKNRYVIGGANLITGDPDSMKTWHSLDLAARLSRGSKWIDGTPVGQPGNTVFLSVEDDASTTLRPRLDMLGGDPARVMVYNSAQPLCLDLSKKGGLDRLEKNILEVGSVKLVVVDPIVDFSGKVNPNAGEEVRALLTPLISMAARLSFALIIVGHLNKNQAMNALYRAGGSTSGWLGKCRSAFMIFRDLDDRQLRHVVPIKANLATQDPPQLEFRITEGQMIAKVSETEVNVDEHLNPQPGRKPRGKDVAIEWLNNLFADRDEMPALDVELAAQKNCICLRTLNKAKTDAGYVSKKQKINGRFQWVWMKKSEGNDEPN